MTLARSVALHLVWGLCGSLLVASTPATLAAQTCDVLVSNTSWSVHPDPDSIWVNFSPDVVTNDPQNPRLYDMAIVIRLDAAPIDQHDLQLRWAHGIGCPVGCPSVVCEEKEWTYKGVIIRDQSKCTLNAQQVCGCPPLGDPVPHRKAIRKPQAPGTIEIEILPLNLQGCNPINPSNDRESFAYPGAGPAVPGAPAGAIVLLMGGLLLAAVLRLRRRSTT